MAVQKTLRTGLETYTDGSDAHPNRTKFNSERQLLDALVALAAQGATGARPAPGILNRLYWDTTVKRLYWDDGAAWNEITTNGGGGAGQEIKPGVESAEGGSARSARADHTHYLALATAAVDGAMGKADKAKLDAATTAATANTLPLRDGNGRFQAGAPVSSGDVSNKGYVDGQIGTRAAAAHTHDAADVTAGVLAPARLPDATQTAAGALSAADKKKLDAASATPAANTLVMLDGNGRTQVATPAAPGDAANKGYVDAQVATSAPLVHTHAWESITAKPATFTPAAHTHPWVDITDKPATYTPAAHGHSGADITSGTVNAARLPAASSTADGIISAADKAKLDTASPLALPNTLVMNGSDGRFRVASPAGADDVTNKGYVDSRVWSGAAITSGIIDAARLPSATPTQEGTMSAADKRLLDTASSGGGGNSIMMRDSTSTAAIDNLLILGGTTDPRQATPKSYVDNLINGRAPSNHTHSWNEITGKPGTFAPIVGFASNQAKPGNWAPTWADISSKPDLVSVAYADNNYAAKSHSHSWGSITGRSAIYNTSVAYGSYRAAWINSDGNLGYNLSSRKYKANERPYQPNPALLDAVEPKWYQYKTDVAEQGCADAPWRVNFIAEDLHDAGLTEYVSYDGKGTARENAETINEQLIVNALWAFAKAQRDQISALESRIADLEGH